MPAADVPFVSIIIPCRNEEPFLARCLDSVLAQTYPAECMEILAADGASTDGTRDILRRYAGEHRNLRWYENAQKIVPTALNVLIKESKGDIVLRMDAHCEYPKDYVAECVRHLVAYKADNVGGVLQAVPGNATRMARAIALALAAPFGVGNSLFRTGAVRSPTWVDTVPFGCFRRDVFDRIGLFDEELIRNQDDEFNARLVKSGGKILLVPGIVLTYYTRTTLRRLWRMYFQYGYFKPLTVRKLGGVMTARQLAPGLLVASLAMLGVGALWIPVCRVLVGGEIVLYAMAAAGAAVAAAGTKQLRLVPHLVLCFAAVHAAYGAGYLRGVLHFLLRRQPAQRTVKDMALSR